MFDTITIIFTSSFFVLLTFSELPSIGSNKKYQRCALPFDTAAINQFEIFLT